jgi:hypothetical protein
MCIRAGNNELESVKNLMGMSLMAVIADALDTEIDNVTEEAHLVEDLNMDSSREEELEAMIEDVFDGLHVDVQSTPTVSALLDKVVMSEFQGLPV